MLARFPKARLALVLFFGLVPIMASRAEQATSHEESLQGLQALQTNRPDDAREHFMDAYRQGLSVDSLYYFLSEAALGKFAYDTAMAFNLSIRTPASEPFRQAVLVQRYKLYAQTGLAKDAAILLDSMSAKPDLPSGRRKEFNWRMGSGYFREDNYLAREYPFGIDLGGFLSEGWQFRNQAELLWPLAVYRGGSLTLGVTGDGIKSYAKDSLDYRAGSLLRLRGLFSDSLAFTFSGDIGNVTGTGPVTSCRLESSYLSFSDIGLTMIQGGYESEWGRSWERRFDGIWFSFYHDRSIRKDRGFNYSFSASAIRVNPIEDRTSLRVMYVDDVTKVKPTHYQNGDFQDTLPGNSIATYQKYTSATGAFDAITRTPQGLVILIPSIGYSFPLPWKFTGETGGTYAFTYYPEVYSWQDAPVPGAFQELATGDFHGLALNRADGKRYAAVILDKNGGFQEFYGPGPLVQRNRHRVDQQLGASLTLRHRLARWGTLSLEGTLKRNWSNLSEGAPLWIPDWDDGANLKWSRSWEWL